MLSSSLATFSSAWEYAVSLLCALTCHRLVTDLLAPVRGAMRAYALYLSVSRA